MDREPLLATASTASAVTYRPTRTDDPRPDGCKAKDCSLREAVVASNAGSMPATILLRPGKRYVLTRQGAGMDADRGDLNITSSGPLAVKTKGGGKTDQATIDANRIDRIFDGSLTLIGVTLRDGLVSGDTGVGGAIRGDILDLRNSRLINNTANGRGSSVNGGGTGGAIYVNSGGELKIDGTRFKGNKATPGSGGAVFISKGASASLFKSTLANNEAGSGGGLAIDAGGRAEVNRSTISGNKAEGDFGSGGGIGLSAPLGGPTTRLEVENSTVANNRSSFDGGGIGSQDSHDFGSHATVQLDHVTVARNQAWTDMDTEEGTHAGTGGGIFGARGDSVSIHNTVVALNTVATRHRPAIANDCFLRPDLPPDSAGFFSLGHNLIGNPDGCTGFGATDLSGGKLGLGKLADNGGPTKTIALTKGSRAIGRAGADAVRVDQRGVKRDKKPDIGAYERRAKK